MTIVRTAAVLFAGAIVMGAGFQLALALGAPWGGLAMAGRYPGRFPAQMRVAAAVQGMILALLGLIVLAAAGVVLPGWQGWADTVVWVAVVVSALSLVANLATPSRAERRLWAPVALVMVVTSLVVALG